MRVGAGYSGWVELGEWMGGFFGTRGGVGGKGGGWAVGAGLLS